MSNLTNPSTALLGIKANIQKVNDDFTALVESNIKFLVSMGVSLAVIKDHQRKISEANPDGLFCQTTDDKFKANLAVVKTEKTKEGEIIALGYWDFLKHESLIPFGQSMVFKLIRIGAQKDAFSNLTPEMATRFGVNDANTADKVAGWVKKGNSIEDYTPQITKSTPSVKASFSFFAGDKTIKATFKKLAYGTPEQAKVVLFNKLAEELGAGKLHATVRTSFKEQLGLIEDSEDLPLISAGFESEDESLSL